MVLQSSSAGSPGWLLRELHPQPTFAAAALWEQARSVMLPTTTARELFGPYGCRRMTAVDVSLSTGRGGTSGESSKAPDMEAAQASRQSQACLTRGDAGGRYWI
jgi:hypothetical protein